MTPTDIPELLFELGSIQVFHYVPFGKVEKTVPKAVYWQDKVSRHTYGPFPTIYDAMTHYTQTIAAIKRPVSVENNIIYMDFKNKRKMSFGIP